MMSMLLRELNVSDLMMILNWRNTPRVRNFMYNDSIIEWDNHYKWYMNNLEKNKVDLKIFEMNGKPLGVVYFSDFEILEKKCKWGFYLGEPDSPKAIGRIMGYLGLEYGFERKGFQKITGEVLSFNEKSVKYHLDLGFTYEEKKNKLILRNGNYENVLNFSLTSETWKSSKRKIKENVVKTTGLSF